MSDDDNVDYSKVDWEEIEMEIEALGFIFPDELEIKQEKPYKMEIKINSNADEDDNHLKMVLLLEVPYNYPLEEIPFMRLKNLSPNFLDNRNLDNYETEIRALARESIGSPMIFTLCEYLREQIAEINDKVLDKYNAAIRK
jgi:hypothetical protein